MEQKENKLGLLLIVVAVLLSAFTVSSCQQMEQEVLHRLTPLAYHQNEIIFLVIDDKLQPAKVQTVLKDSLIVDYIGTEVKKTDIKISVRDL